MAAAVLVVALPAAGDTPPAQPSSQERRSLAGTTPPFGGDDYNDQTIPVQRTTAEVRKAKVQFVFPDVYLHANVLICFASLGDDAYFGDDLVQKNCSDVAPLPLPPGYVNTPDAGFASGYAEAYVTDHHGRNARNTYGSFPAVKVRSLVFGSIPVSATVQLEQTETNGVLNPIVARYGNIVNLDIPGVLAYPGFPVVPRRSIGFPTDTAQDLTFKNSLDATLRLRLTDVAVDGRPVDVGTRCGTVSPVRLTVREPLGYAPTAAYNPQVRGLPGGFFPGQGQDGKSPGYFDGNVDVPAFSGCGSATEDLDPLLTALVSSPVNRVTGFLPVSTLLDFYCSSEIADNTCPQAATAAQRRMQALAVAIAKHESPAEIRKLQAQLKPSDYVMPKVKPNGVS